MKTLTFLLDVGADTGLGHWHRCIALAEVLRQEWTIEFITPPLAPALALDISSRRIQTAPTKDWSPSGVRQALFALGVNRAALVLDLSSTSIELVGELRRDLPVFTIGGAGPGRAEVDLRIDGMIPRPGFSDDFRGKTILVGPEYVILRPEFTPLSKPVRPVLKRVLVALGGDACGEGVALAAALAVSFPSLVFDVVVGPLAMSGLAALRTCVWQNPASLAPLLRKADLALSRGGMTANELCRMGVPMILFPHTALQHAAAEAYRERGVAVLVNDYAELVAAIHDLAAPKKRDALRCAGLALIDGQGVARVAAAISAHLLHMA